MDTDIFLRATSATLLVVAGVSVALHGLTS